MGWAAAGIMSSCFCKLPQEYILRSNHGDRQQQAAVRAVSTRNFETIKSQQHWQATESSKQQPYQNSQQQNSSSQEIDNIEEDQALQTVDRQQTASRYKTGSDSGLAAGSCRFESGLNRADLPTNLGQVWTD
jgi:hypothetical protein